MVSKKIDYEAGASLSLLRREQMEIEPGLNQSSL